MRASLFALLLAFGLASAGCARISSIGDPPPPPGVTQVPALPAAVADGAIFQARRGYVPLFEDRRPRRIGDILTIVLNEEVSASKSTESSANRSASASLTLEDLPDVLDQLAEYGFEFSGESAFNGGAGARANNTFTGTITVTVEEVMGNGNLRVQGEKQIAINRGTEFIRFSGVVNPRTISGRNSVPSTEVAAARIEYFGDGYAAAATRMGWLQRFFLSVSPI